MKNLSNETIVAKQTKEKLVEIVNAQTDNYADVFIRLKEMQIYIENILDFNFDAAAEQDVETFTIAQVKQLFDSRINAHNFISNVRQKQVS